MGGLVALEHACAARGVRGIVASAPLLGIPDPLPAGVVLAARVLSWLLPTFRFGNRLEPARLCSDAAVVAAYLGDPLVISSVTARWSTEMLAALERVRQKVGTCTAPLLCLYGGDDRIVDTAAIERLAAAWGGHATVRSWPGLRHEILNEPSRGEILDTIVEWLELHAANHRAG
jgi:lysophospholipase